MFAPVFGQSGRLAQCLWSLGCGQQAGKDLKKGSNRIKKVDNIAESSNYLLIKYTKHVMSCKICSKKLITVL